MEELRKIEDRELDFQLCGHIEAVIFVSDQAVSLTEIEQTLKKVVHEKVKRKAIVSCIEFLKEKYDRKDSAIELVEMAGGFRLLTKAHLHKTVAHFLNIKTKKKLSRPALETLSIIAYKQPVTKSQIEEIRGVSADYSIQKLLEKNLIIISGRADSPGKPLIYELSPWFLDHFGINSTDDLPKLKEVVPQHNEIGSHEKEEVQPLS